MTAQPSWSVIIFLKYGGLPSCIIQAVLSPNRHILLKAGENNETIDVFYSGTGDTDNLEFSFLSQVSIPNPNGTNHEGVRARVPLLAFFADGTKFAAGTDDGVVSVWDVQSKTPLKVFEVDVPEDVLSLPTPYLQFLQFSSGIIRREVLAFIAAVSQYSYPELPTYLFNKCFLE